MKRDNFSPSQQSSHTPKQPPQLIIDLTNSDSDDEDLCNIHYPTVYNMLVELQSELQHLDIMFYEATLTEHGFWYVDQLVGEEARRQLQDELGFPFRVVDQLQSRAARMMRRAQKLKQEEE